MIMPDGIREDLDAALAFGWQLIETAVKDRHSPYHLPVLATVAAEGGPSARIVVLRAADAANWRLRCHTDNRSGKFADISADPRVMFHFYDPVHKVQIRAFGEAVLHQGNATANAAWADSAASSKQCYFADPGPGMPVEAPTNGLPVDPTAFENAEIGLAAFTVVEAAISRLEWVHLDHRGHRRALFDRTADGFQKSWLVP